MCTIILAHRIYPGTPLLVAANRDELLDRPAAGPRLLPVGGLEVFAPLDLLEGGTWLGLNSAGVFVGITNRFGAGRDADRRSRGELVFSALSEPTAIRAARPSSETDNALVAPSTALERSRCAESSTPTLPYLESASSTSRRAAQTPTH